MRLFFIPLVTVGVLLSTSAFANTPPEFNLALTEQGKACAPNVQATENDDDVVRFVENALEKHTRFHGKYFNGEEAHFALLYGRGEKEMSYLAQIRTIKAIMAHVERGRTVYYDLEAMKNRVPEDVYQWHFKGSVDGISYLDKKQTHDDVKDVKIWHVHVPMKYGFWHSENYAEGERIMDWTDEPAYVKAVVVFNKRQTCTNPSNMVITDVQLLPEVVKEVKESKRLKLKRWLNKLDETLMKLDEKSKQ